MVNRYELPLLQKAYFASSTYARSEELVSQDFLTWPNRLYSEQLRPDLQLLRETLVPPTSLDESVAAQVFGNQLRQEKISVQHQAHLLQERAALYASQMADLTSSHLKIQEALFCERINSPHEATRRQMALEGLLFRLESEQRKAELEFWKDTRDVRETLFEKAQAYQAVSQRASFLERIGGDDDQYKP